MRTWAPHYVHLNCPAIEMAKIDPNHKDPHIHHYSDGRLSGVFTEAYRIMKAFTPVMSIIAEASGVEGLNFFGRIGNSVGVTTIADLIFGVIEWDSELKENIAATDQN